MVNPLLYDSLIHSNLPVYPGAIRRKPMRKAKEKEETSSPVKTPKVDRTEGADKSQDVGGNVAEAGNVEKIRDIIFGAQMRDYEKRFARLEERMLREMTNFRDETKRRFDSLENHFRKEVESLGDRVKAEQDERTESGKELSKDLKDTTKLFEKKIGRLDEQLSKSSRDLRQQILDQSKSLSDEIRQKHGESLAALDRANQELRSDKLDRATLSELLTEMAMRLTDEGAMKLGLEPENLENE